MVTERTKAGVGYTCKQGFPGKIEGFQSRPVLTSQGKTLSISRLPVCAREIRNPVGRSIATSRIANRERGR